MSLKFNYQTKNLQEYSGEKKVVFDLKKKEAIYNGETIAKLNKRTKTWVMSSEPYYRGSGWGRDSKGDYYAYNNHRAIRNLLEKTGLPIQIGEVNLKKQKEKSKLEERAKKLGLDVYESSYSYERNRSYYVERKKKEIDLDKIAQYPNDLKKLINNFLKGKGGKLYNITATKHSLFITDVDYFNEEKVTTIVAIKTDKGIILNSQDLTVTDKYGFFYSKKGQPCLLQKLLRKSCKIQIPFNVLQSAQLDINKTTIIEQGPEEDLMVGNTKRHFTGALLLENGDKQFLFDVDRNELQHGIWNPFFTNIPHKVSSIKEAYDSLMPTEVKDAIDKGVEVKRQGEWFFIKQNDTMTMTKALFQSYSGDGSKFHPNRLPWQDKTRENYSAILRHGNSRPNTCLSTPLIRDQGLVFGIVEHTGREHNPLDLGHEVNGPDVVFQVWKAVPNTAVGNFTIQGDVD